MCKVFNVSRSGYYDWLNRKPSSRQLENQQVIEEIQMVYQQSKGRYGSPKITEELRDRGWKVSRPRVARIMSSEGIKSIVNKKFKVLTTDSRHNLPIAENILDRDFVANASGRKWVSDITYIPTHQGWVYLTIIMDLYDRKIIGWALSSTMTAKDTILAAWRMAILNRPVYPNQLIFHSDRGVQYASYAFTSKLKYHKVTQSMSRKGNCWDNAVAENFFRILKTEMVRHTNFYSILQAKAALFEFIEIWYNRKRKHAYLDYQTPEQFHGNNYVICA